MSSDSSDIPHPVHAEHCDVVLHNDCCGHTDPFWDCSCGGPWIPVPHSDTDEATQLVERIATALVSIDKTPWRVKGYDPYRARAWAVLTELNREQ